MFKIPNDPQVVFDTVARHLLTQKMRSVGENSECLYRSPKGLKCAAGCLIPDDKYSSTMEGKCWDVLAAREIVSSTNQSLIANLQLIHDRKDPKHWLNELYTLAANLELNTSVLSEFER